MLRIPATVVACLVGGLVPGALRAQCPDGSPPPCERARPRAAAAAPAPAPDANLVAILPFRVTTSDTLLGEGFAELLATQFTGEGSPRAVDMATALSAWRRAGGGLRSPLPRARAVQLGRDLGAGLVSEGSIVGLGQRVTVSATLVSVPSGDVRGTALPVSGPADSLDALLRQMTTRLLAVVGGQAERGDATRFTESPAAMRAYLEGLSAWRRGRLYDAAAAFDRAIAEDSAFAQARFRRFLAANWGIPGPGAYARMAWERRDGLSQRERAILETLLGPEYPAPRTMDERFAARQRLVDTYPDSPDARYLLGDYFFHYGPVLAPGDYLDRARQHLERAAAIDSQATVLNHLAWIGLIQRDTMLMERAWRAQDRTQDEPRWMFGWLMAAGTGDAALLSALRRRGVDDPDAGGSLMGAFAAAEALAPARLKDEMFERWIAAITAPGHRNTVRAWWGFVQTLGGRPGAAERTWAALPPDGRRWVEEARLTFDLEGLGAGLDVPGAVRRLVAAAEGGADPRAECLVALWRLERGDGVAVDADRFRQAQPRCARAMDAAMLGRSRAADAGERLAALDSAVRNSVSTAGSESFESIVLARAWESRGDARRALAAIGYRVSAPSEAVVGRLAVLAGDTARAVRAYRRFLEATAEAEPAIAPQREAARQTVERLLRRP